MSEAVAVDQRGRTADSFVLDYIAARRAWEIESGARMQAVEAAGDMDEELRVWGSVEASYFAFMRPFVAPELLRKLTMSLATPTEMDPSTTRIVSVQDKEHIVVVTTEEASPVGEAFEFEYLLRLVDGEWQLENRKSRDLDGRWMSFLL